MRKSRFGTFLSIYALVLIAASIVGLRVLWNFLACYEASLPDGAVSAYEETMEEAFLSVLDQYAEGHATALQTAREVRSYALTQVDTEKLNLRKDGESFLIRLGRETIGRLPLVYSEIEGMSFGFRKCGIGEAQWDWNPELSAQWKIIAPMEAEVFVNSRRLSAENAAIREVPAHDGALYRDLEQVPALEYTFSYYGTPQPQIGENETLEFVMEQAENEFTVTPFFREDASGQLRSAAEKFITSYIAYTSHAAGYSKVMPYLVQGSAFAQRIAGSVDGMKWVSGVTSTISNLSLDHFAPYGNATVCEAHYDLTDKMGGVKNCNMRMVLENINGRWKVWNIEMF